MFDKALYLRAAENLRENEGQWEAYESKGNCVLLAGPGSGKTKTLTIKLARILAEEIEEPRGLACLTYNNECARELETRLQTLGVDAGGRVFIGTVHSFSLTQIILPYARTANLGLPENFKVATIQDQRLALERAYRRTIGGPGNPQDSSFGMARYRRTILNRDSEAWRTRDPELARLVVEYETELRNVGLIDFDDMPLLALRALRENEWLRKAILAKYPVLAVDEYQDLGLALHRMVMGLCFSTGMRLFAVGDVDQSIYGFTGAHPELLERVAERDDVQTVKLKFNYRCGSTIVTASEYALGEVRGYKSPEGSHQGTIYFHALAGSYQQQAEHLFSTVLPEIAERIPDIKASEIGILYPAAFIGDALAESAERHSIGVVRADTNSFFPRSSRIMRWLEQCAVWCCGGWKSGEPRFTRLVGEGKRIFAESLLTEDSKAEFQRQLMSALWARRNRNQLLHTWLRELDEKLIDELIGACRTLGDEKVTLGDVIEKTREGHAASAMTLCQFAGDGDENDRINLSTLHSAKGREFVIVILFGIDAGRLPRSGSDVREARRLFYVGFTRPKEELHIVHSFGRASQFVTEVQARMEEI